MQKEFISCRYESKVCTDIDCVDRPSSQMLLKTSTMVLQESEWAATWSNCVPGSFFNNFFNCFFFNMTHRIRSKNTNSGDELTNSGYQWNFLSFAPQKSAEYVKNNQEFINVLLLLQIIITQNSSNLIVEVYRYSNRIKKKKT